MDASIEAHAETLRGCVDLVLAEGGLHTSAAGYAALDALVAALAAERERAEEDQRKVEAYNAARYQVKREGFSRAEYVLRAEVAERENQQLRDALASEGVQYALRWIREGRSRRDPVARDIDALMALASVRGGQPPDRSET